MCRGPRKNYIASVPSGNCYKAFPSNDRQDHSISAHHFMPTAGRELIQIKHTVENLNWRLLPR
jgi:hypothetical protein